MPHLIDGFMHSFNNCRCNRLCHVTDAKADNLFVRICFAVGIYLLCNRTEKVASRKFLIIIIDLVHVSLLIPSIQNSFSFKMSPTTQRIATLCSPLSHT